MIDQKGVGLITVERRSDGSTVASELFASYPIRLHITGRQNDPNHNHDSEKGITCYILGYGGGLVSGDRIRISINVQPGASLVVTSQSTSKAYKSLPLRKETAVITCARVQRDALLFLAPQPTQCFSRSRLCQETHIVLDDTLNGVSESIDQQSPSLVLLDWFTGGRIGIDEGPWSFDMFCGHINIVYTRQEAQARGLIETLPFESQTFFRDTTTLSGGEDLRRHMRHFNVVCTLLLIGPRTHETAAYILKTFSSRHLYEDDSFSDSHSTHHCMNIGDGLNNDGLLVSCGTFHRLIHNKVRQGAIMRVAAASIEIAAGFLSENIGTLHGQLKEDPFMEILTLSHSLQQGISEHTLHRIVPRSLTPLSDGFGLLKYALSTQNNFYPHGSLRESSTSKLLLYQLSDASCPTGAFAHSYTIEVSSQLKIIRPRDGSFKADICQHIWEVLLQTFTTSVPFLIASCRIFDQLNISSIRSDTMASFSSLVDEWDQLDLELSTTINSHVASRASSLQGSGMFRAFSNAFPHISLVISDLKRRVLIGSKHEQIYRGHSATCFGAIAAMLGIDAATATSVFLYTTCRDMVNAAVRMNLIGPLEGGNVIYSMGGMIEALIQKHLHQVGSSGIIWFQAPNIISFQTCPLLDILSNAHDRLYTRLFNS